MLMGFVSSPFESPENRTYIVGKTLWALAIVSRCINISHLVDEDEWWIWVQDDEMDDLADVYRESFFDAVIGAGVKTYKTLKARENKS